ncbi:hypothetical protein [Ancylobacter tetraedralis]
MDGFKLCNYVRNRELRVKIIVASGEAIIEESALPTGRRFFYKPYHDRVITDAIGRMPSNEARKSPAVLNDNHLSHC